MELFEKKNSKFYWYDFTVRDKRYRGSTKQTIRVKAEKVAALKLAEAMEENNLLDRKVPTLREHSSRFLEWVNTARLAPGRQTYYRSGWKMLQNSAVASMKLDQIATDDAEALRFPGFPANGNKALRTLSRMLSKAKEWKLLRYVPEFKLFKETGRTLKLDDEAERKLLLHADQPLRDIIVIMRDTGMRNGRELTGYASRTLTGTIASSSIPTARHNEVEGDSFEQSRDRDIEDALRRQDRRLGLPRFSQRQVHLL